jgi:uncharacterized protein (TIGR02452 family)
MNKSQLSKIPMLNKDYVVNHGMRIPLAMIFKYGQVPIKPSPNTGQTIVSFEAMKTDDCAIHYLQKGFSKNIVVMNFASRTTRGGGYLRGASAQEEDLCRTIPQLHPSLYQIQYPFEPNSVLITPNVDIVRNNVDYELFEGGAKYNISVVSAAAPNLRREQFDEASVIRTLENLYVSVKYCLSQTDTLIVGAWGCGAYRNSPHIMAKIMDTINKNFGGYYNRIVFSIPNLKGDNFKIFRQLIK